MAGQAKYTTVRVSAQTRAIIKDIQVAIAGTADDVVRILLDRVDLAKLIQDHKPINLDRLMDIANSAVAASAKEHGETWAAPKD